MRGLAIRNFPADCQSTRLTSCCRRDARSGHDQDASALARLDVVRHSFEAALRQGVWWRVIAYDRVLLAHLELARRPLVGTVPLVSLAVAAAAYFEGFPLTAAVDYGEKSHFSYNTYVKGTLAARV